MDKNREHKKREEDILVDMWVACDLEHKGKKWLVIRTKLEEVGGIGGTKWINLTEHGVRGWRNG